MPPMLRAVLLLALAPARTLPPGQAQATLFVESTVGVPGNQRVPAPGVEARFPIVKGLEMGVRSRWLGVVLGQGP